MDARARSYLDRADEALGEDRFVDAIGFVRLARDQIRKLGDPPEGLEACRTALERIERARKGVRPLAASPRRRSESPPLKGSDPSRAAGAAGSVEEVLAELDALVGLAEVKARIRALTEFLRVQGVREQAGLRNVDVSQHLAFTGSPGTGKTTVARLFGRLLHALGALATDRLVETSRAQLVAGFVGQTSARVDAVVDSALDGVLFIDEAYSLTESGSQEDFGNEAVTQLVKRMEDERGRLAVIVAGYTAPMTRFLESNPGLRSRIGEIIEFPDYAPDELQAIFARFCADADYELSPGAAERLRAVLTELYDARDKTFGNARTVRNLFEDAIVAQASRLVDVRSHDRELLRTLEPADVDAALAAFRDDAS